jgi:hypothetical protein
MAVGEIVWSEAGDRSLLWIAAGSSQLIPQALRPWQKAELVGLLGTIPGTENLAGRYSVIFEATCNSVLNYDPFISVQAVRARFEGPPLALVAIVAPSLEVPVASQHAIAHEVGLLLGSPRVDVVAIDDRWSAQSESKVRKGDDDHGVENSTALDLALEIAMGRKTGRPVDPAAESFVYAYYSRAKVRTPFRCTPLQREILHVVASGAFVPGTAAIASAVFSSEKKVSDSIGELVNQFVPRSPGEPGQRDGRERLFWLLHHYGVWIRLANGRSRSGGINPLTPRRRVTRLGA